MLLQRCPVVPCTGKLMIFPMLLRFRPEPSMSMANGHCSWREAMLLDSIVESGEPRRQPKRAACAQAPFKLARHCMYFKSPSIYV